MATTPEPRNPAPDDAAKWVCISKAYDTRLNHMAGVKEVVAEAFRQGLAIDPARLVVTDAMVEEAFWAHHRVPPKYQRNALRAALEAAFAMVKGDGNAT